MRFVAVSAVFVTALITANIIAVKLITIGPFLVPAAIVIFPVSYIVGDVLTEVYGYHRARQVIWLGFACNLLAVAAIWASLVLPAAPGWGTDPGGLDVAAAYARILGFAPRILAASFAAYLVGELANALTLARLKVLTQGRHLWARTIGSTIVGQGLDSLVFITLAFGFNPAIIVGQWFVKSAYEALATPLTYAVVNALKRLEGVDTFDRHLPLNPFPVEPGRA
jgi:uncharacterized integral membrane protein (TIGR00697 family)